MKMLNFKPGCSSEGRCYTTLANSQNRKNVRENPCLCIHAGSRMRSFQFSHIEIFLSKILFLMSAEKCSSKLSNCISPLTVNFKQQ